MWKPTTFRTGLGRARLGQQNTLTERMAAAVVSRAEPRLRQVIAEERNRWADAILSGLPYAGVSILGFIVAPYIPSEEKAIKTGAYAASLLLAGISLFKTVDGLREPVQPKPLTKDGIVQDVIATFVDPASRQMAKAIVEEAMPRVEQIVEEERQRATDAVHTAIPWLGVSVLAALGTIFLVPDTMPMAKVGGYGATAASTLIGIYQGVEVSR